MRPAWDARWHPFGKRACWHHVWTARSTTLVFSSRESRFLAFMFLSTFCIPFPWMACDRDAESNDKALCKQKLLAARPCDNKSLKVGHFPTRTRVFFKTHVTTCGGHLGDDRAKVATNDLQGPTRQGSGTVTTSNFLEGRPSNFMHCEARRRTCLRLPAVCTSPPSFSSSTPRKSHFHAARKRFQATHEPRVPIHRTMRRRT